MTGIELEAEGWHYVQGGKLPPSKTTVEFARDERVHWQLPWFGKWEDLPPEFNVMGLWWRDLMESA